MGNAFTDRAIAQAKPAAAGIRLSAPETVCRAASGQRGVLGSAAEETVCATCPVPVEMKRV